MQTEAYKPGAAHPFFDVDGDGIVTTDFGALSDDDARALVIQPDGRILVVGTAGEDIALARYTPDGKLDTTFGTGGTQITDLGFDDVATGVTLTPDGKIVICGNTIGAELNNDFLLARYNTNGTLDTTFGTGGTVKTDLSGGDDFAENLTIDATGRIVVVGRSISPTSPRSTTWHSSGTTPTGHSTPPSPTTASSSPTSTAATTPARTSQSMRPGGSSPPGTPTMAPAPSSR